MTFVALQQQHLHGLGMGSLMGVYRGIFCVGECFEDQSVGDVTGPGIVGNRNMADGLSCGRLWLQLHKS